MSLVLNEEERIGLLHQEATNSWTSTASLIVCAMAGVGVLGLPGAMNATGWSGVVLLVVVAVASGYTGIILGRATEETPDVQDYAEVGEHAFGKWGRWSAQFSVYMTLAGVAIIFLILLGLLMNGIVPAVSHAFWTVAIGVVVASPLAISLKSYGEIKIISWFGFMATSVVVVVAVALCLSFYFSGSYTESIKQDGFKTEFINIDTFAVGFSVFTFAFGATAIFPNIYIKMEKRAHWDRAMVGGYVAALALYFPISVCGYFVYGSYLKNASTILAAIADFDDKGEIYVKICSGIMIAHILSAFPIVVNPVFLAIEKYFSQRGNASEIVIRVVGRSVILACLIAIACFFPYFLDVMSLISCISVSLSGFILPCLFYWKICKPTLIEKIFLSLIIVFGVVGSTVGIIISTKQLVSDVQQNPNPFDHLFSF